MKGLKLEIRFTGGRWLVNGKRLADLSDQEKEFMNNFFKEVKTEEARKDEEVKNFIKRQAADQSATINYRELEKQL